MPLEKLERTQLIPTTLAEAWSFFSRPGNLAAITPPSMAFQVTSAPQETMYAGMIVTYKVSPMPGLPLNWVTEITHVEAPSFFIDEQRIGPYHFWHHQHHFREVADGVEMRDIVHYQLPFGPLALPVSWLVKRRLEAIFGYRVQAVERIFGSGKP
ncbi:SRPBCC family protein [Geomonas sp. Red32]|uniref:SRPBCC family protein n=1 Tax=Geomonas sp. Red32 TaxID=2912856 RepID=UPI00202CC6B3|nr:SRPBCC family protein [Geomonas sp. Red32]MCM0083638.1 SRPBCC family protein [Geomonas sp. Red32]